MHNVDEMLDTAKLKKNGLKITLEVNGTTFDVYFANQRDKRLFVELMSDYFEDMECRDDNGNLME